MEKVDEFLEGDQKVFLLLGDSGAGKSTFNRELDYQLWLTYKKNGVIPLHINLPAIDKPEHDDCQTASVIRVHRTSDQRIEGPQKVRVDMRRIR